MFACKSHMVQILQDTSEFGLRRWSSVLLQKAVQHLLDVLEGVPAQVVGLAGLPQPAVLEPLGFRLSLCRFVRLFNFFRLCSLLP